MITKTEIEFPVLWMTHNVLYHYSDYVFLCIKPTTYVTMSLYVSCCWDPQVFQPLASRETLEIPSAI